MSAKDACCGLVAKLGPKLAELDAELRRPNHLSFRKLAVEYEAGHSAIERHKKGCLKLGTAIGGAKVAEFQVPDLTGVPAVQRRPSRKDVPAGVPRGVPSESIGESGDGAEVSQVSHAESAGTEGGTPGTVRPGGTDGAGWTRAPAHGSANASEVHRNRVLEIVSAISDGTWDTPRDNVARRVKEWGLSKTTVERMVREAAVGAEVDPETVKARRAVSLGRWGWGLERTKDEIKDLSAGDEMLPALLKVYAQMQTGWDRAAGVLDESTKIQVNVVAHPVFEAMLSSVLIAVAPYPEARAAVAAAVRAKLDVLRQPAPSLLAEGSIETTGEAA